MQAEPTPLVRKLGAFVELSDEEIARLDDLQAQVRMVEPHSELVSEGLGGQECYVLLDGWAISYKLLADGRRQIIKFLVPGDFVGEQSLLLQTANHSIETLTRATVGQLAREPMLQTIGEMPRLAVAILWALSRDEAIIVEHLVNIGRRSALERTAHLLLELFARLKLVGLTTDHAFECPATQHELGDALGLTPIHVSRTLRQLRERGLISLAQRRVTIHDLRGLKQLAHFSAGYLDDDSRVTGQPGRGATSPDR